MIKKTQKLELRISGPQTSYSYHIFIGGKPYKAASKDSEAEAKMAGQKALEAVKKNLQERGFTVEIEGAIPVVKAG